MRRRAIIHPSDDDYRWRRSEVVSVRWGTALLLTLIFVAATGALDALGKSEAGLKPGALYTSAAKTCTGIPAGTTCVFKFRASSDGHSLQFVGKTVVDTWHCNGGGGEAFLGGKFKDADPIPRVKLSTGGTLYGSVLATSSSGNKYTVMVNGHIANGGAAAVVTFHSIPVSGTVKCATPPVTLTR